MKKHIDTRDAFFIGAVFVFALLVNCLYFNWKAAPLLCSDSKGYIGLAQDMRNLRLPNFLSRGPSYPLYLFVFNVNIKLAAYFQVIIGAVTIALLYAIIVRILRHRWLACLVSCFIALDFEPAAFQSYILTETLSACIVLASLYARLFFMRRKTGVLKIGAYLFLDLFLIFLKPSFVLLPFCYYMFEFAYRIFLRQREAPFVKDIWHIILCAAVVISVILGFCVLDYSRYGLFSFSVLGDIGKTK